MTPREAGELPSRHHPRSGPACRQTFCCVFGRGCGDKTCPCRHSFSCLLGGATPASDRAAAAVAGPPLAVSVLLLLSMTRGKKTCKKAKDVRDTGKGEPDLMQLTC